MDLCSTQVCAAPEKTTYTIKMSEVSSASVLRISDQKTLQLIELYNQEDCLWNTKIEDYKNKEKRIHAVQKIATILDLPNFTAKHVIMKFKNLRNSYSQELKKIAQSISSGATGEDVYVPRVFWFSKMDSFIKPHLQGKGPRDEALIYRQDSRTDEWVQVDNAEQVFNPDTSLAEPSASEEDECSNDSSRKRKRVKYAAKKGKAVIEEHKSVSQSLKDIQAHLHVLVSHNDDYHDTFGKYVASLLRSLPAQEALALQPKIVSLIINTGMEGNKGDGEGQVTSECQSTHHEDAALNINVDKEDSDSF